MSASEEVIALMREIRQEFDRSISLLTLTILNETSFEIPEDISHIQNLHDVVVQDLDCLAKSLNSHVAIVEKTELIMNILSYKLYEIQFEFRTQFDKLKERKYNLTRKSWSGDPNVALELVQIDDEISKLEELNQNNLECIKEQKLDSQKAYERSVSVMDENFEKMTNGLNKLLMLIEAEKSAVSDSQTHLIDDKYFEEVQGYRKEIDKLTGLQTAGWKELYPEEKISELLHQRGLKILHSGHLINDEGQVITFKEAKANKLFNNLGPEMLKEIKANLLSEGDDDETVLTETSYTSVQSSMSSDDVNYLKECLGKPLTLALAEITTLQPRDPIHYLGHWLFKYRYNQQMEDVNLREFECLQQQRNEIAKQMWHKFIEEEAKAAVIDMIVRAEEIGAMNIFRRIQREAEALEEIDDEARDTLGPLTGTSANQLPK